MQRPHRGFAIAIVVAALGCRPRERTEPAPVADDTAPAPAATDEAESAPASVPAMEVAPLPADRPPRTIYRVELDRALARGPGWLMGQLAPEPVKQDGRFVGWRIGAVFPDAPDLCPPGCDLLAGDVILAVHGDPLRTPQALEAMIGRLDTLTALEVDRVRDGTRQRVTYAIADAP
jgi:S1-C subfamily serine protease